MPLKEELEKQGNWLFKYRGSLPIIILIIGCLVYILNRKTFILEGTPYITYYEIACLLVGLFGLFIRIYTVGYTPANTSGRNTGEQLADTVNTTGIYSTVRHPLYVGNFFMWLAPVLLTGNFWFIIAFCLFYWVYYERIMFAEEEFLRKKFGDQYTEWASKTPAFIPNFKLFVKPNLPFSWKKVLKKEKNGLVALLMIFCLFDILGEVIDKEYQFNYFFIGAFLFSLILYFILKFMKHKTRILDEKGR